MRNLFILFSILLLVVSCKKEDDCIVDEGSGFSVRYDMVTCHLSENIDNEIQYKVFYEFEDFQSNPCFNGSLSRPLFSNELMVVAILVRTNFYYKDKKAEIKRDFCNNKIFYKLIMSNIDYTIGNGEPIENYHSSVSLLDSVITEQEVIFDVKFE